MKKMKVQAENIVCSACAEDMEKVLLDTDGVVDASVDFRNETISIDYDPSIVDRKHAYAAIRKFGRIRRIISES